MKTPQAWTRPLTTEVREIPGGYELSEPVITLADFKVYQAEVEAQLAVAKELVLQVSDGEDIGSEWHTKARALLGIVY